VGAFTDTKGETTLFFWFGEGRQCNVNNLTQAGQTHGNFAQVQAALGSLGPTSCLSEIIEIIGGVG
jgi:hypothetical protein